METKNMVREDALAWVLRAAAVGLPVDRLLDEARAISEFLNGDAVPDSEPDWSDVSVHADLVEERDEALAEAESMRRALDETRQHLIKGVLMEVKRMGRSRPDLSGVGVADDLADLFGVEL